MDPKLAFWTWALANMALAVGCAAAGVWRARRHDVRNHRRLMLASIALVLLFLAAYAVKASLLGREDRSGWEPHTVTVLRVHEVFVAAMLVAGAWAARLAWRLPPPRLAFRDPAARRRHARAGRIAVSCGAVALLLAVELLRRLAGP